MGVPPNKNENHPCYFRIVHSKPSSYWGDPHDLARPSGALSSGHRSGAAVALRGLLWNLCGHWAHGDVMGMSWGCHGDVMGMSWGCHGDVMGMSWGCHGTHGLKHVDNLMITAIFSIFWWVEKQTLLFFFPETW